MPSRRNEIEMTGDELRDFLDLVDRYGGGAPEMKNLFRQQARKRIGLRFVPTRVVSWDHRKLGGAY